MEAYIITGFRSAVGRAKKGGFQNYRSDDLAVDVIRHLMSTVPELDPKLVDDVIVGCANPEGEQGLQVGRLIAARALGKEVPGITINRYCASGLESIAMAVGKIKAGFGDVYLAGGAESMSMIPMTGYKLSPSYKAAMDNINYHVSMGKTAEAVAEKYDVSREQADAFSVRSHERAAAAIDAGKFDGQIVPIEVEDVFVKDGKMIKSSHTVKMDEGVRRDTTMEGLGKLRAVFKDGGVVTAGNSSQTSDGAAFVLVMSERMVKQLGLEPVARLVSCSVGGVDPLYMGIGPCVAVPKALERAGLKIGDIQQTELNEAFATQALAVIKTLGIDPETVNPNGGAIALGHPLGCTGAKLTIQLLDEMQRRGQKYGMVTACVGGGQGIAGIFERLN
ncbi:acetyl-CoA C-acyltransferase [Neolewinella lacunae]|uniref:acetyl-CoA C-acyltransferase n=1 Tax=Neolewinella lacunae TaxID=1517758 RepID=A0A923PKQ5_9BACT|nr:acetyl-CoA C-acyltransferase [Neolewinella lacunae]MBC6995882.1 acetyl-CoA C-acyltransferase [Neolewinella lacunae]MDN3636426.1 acetyl-CoA C-acyltransferase [Neolewinella lacunae]